MENGRKVKTIENRGSDTDYRPLMDEFHRYYIRHALAHVTLGRGLNDLYALFSLPRDLRGGAARTAAEKILTEFGWLIEDAMRECPDDDPGIYANDEEHRAKIPFGRLFDPGALNAELDIWYNIKSGEEGCNAGRLCDKNLFARIGDQTGYFRKIYKNRRRRAVEFAPLAGIVRLLLHDNLRRFFDNLRRYDEIRRDNRILCLHSGGGAACAAAGVTAPEEAFIAGYYNRLLTLEGIRAYNRLLARLWWKDAAALIAGDTAAAPVPSFHRLKTAPLEPPAADGC